MRDPIQRWLLYARTLRHLRAKQWMYLPLRRLQRLGQGRTRLTRAPALSDLSRVRDVLLRWGPRDGDAIARAEAVIAGRFTFLNHTETLRAIDWRRRYVNHLWSYNLQYFDYSLDLAWAWRFTGDPRYAERFVQLATSWIEETRGRGDGWEPYAVSLRTVNWIYALALFEDALSADARSAIAASLYSQLVLLEQRIEWHLLANHVQKNLQALTIGSCVFADTAARRWQARFVPRLWAEVEEQVLSDGGHFERSPMYHTIALVDFLETIAVIRAAGGVVPQAVFERVQAMVRANAVLRRANGTLHLFNDAAHGIAPQARYVDQLAVAVLGESAPHAVGPFALPITGYYGIAVANGDRLVVDCGPGGPDYQLGHTHCDLLSYELDLAGRPVVVDAGVSGYDGDPFREYVRSTRAHNTVVIDGQEQQELWGVFRVARRAAILGAEQAATGNRYSFRGAYRPYTSRAAHHREICREEHRITVVDTVERRPGARLESHLHLHPSLDVVVEGMGALVHDSATGAVIAALEFFGTDEVVAVRGARNPVQGWHCPEFGRAVPAYCLTAIVHRNDGRRFGVAILPLSEPAGCP